VYVVLGIGVGLIIIRVLLKALAANTGAAFTGFVYGITDPLVAPFQGIFATRQAGTGSVFEFSSVVALRSSAWRHSRAGGARRPPTSI
jgi:uncharacterized protein YggT (Ycf19 family)